LLADSFLPSFTAVEYLTDVAFDKLEHSLQTVSSLPNTLSGSSVPLMEKEQKPFGVKKEL
jgi:hypothetical protein